MSYLLCMQKLVHLEPRNVTTNTHHCVQTTTMVYQTTMSTNFIKTINIIADYFLMNILYLAMILVRCIGFITPISISTLSSAFRRRSPSMPHFWKMGQYLSSLYSFRKSRTVCSEYCTTPPCSLRWNSIWKYTRSEISNLICIVGPAGQQLPVHYLFKPHWLLKLWHVQCLYRNGTFFPACHLVGTKKIVY